MCFVKLFSMLIASDGVQSVQSSGPKMRIRSSREEREQDNREAEEAFLLKESIKFGVSFGNVWIRICGCL